MTLACSSAGSAAAAPAPPKLDAKSWLLLDARDGERLAARSPSRPLPVASATKLMTAYLALEELPPDRKLRVGSYSASPVESVLGLQAADRVSVRDLLYAVLLPSANDAAVALAREVSGSVPRFVVRMNRAATRLGLDDTEYANPIGLDAPGHRSSAADLAALTLILREDGTFRRIVDTPEATVSVNGDTVEVRSRNELVRDLGWIDGVKTGHTLGAGYVLVASGKRKGVPLVSVVLGAPSEAARDAETLKLLDYGFSLYRRERAVVAGEEVTSSSVAYQGETLDLVARRGLIVPVRRGQAVETEVSAPDEVDGPIDRGERLGRVVVRVGGSPAGSSPLVAARSVGAPTVLERSRAWAPGALVAAAAIVILIGLVARGRRRRSGNRIAEERSRQSDERMRRRDKPGT